MSIACFYETIPHPSTIQFPMSIETRYNNRFGVGLNDRIQKFLLADHDPQIDDIEAFLFQCIFNDAIAYRMHICPYDSNDNCFHICSLFRILIDFMNIMHNFFRDQSNQLINL
jgi:hypothetical protein